jgi:CHAT domain-containing protein
MRSDRNSRLGPVTPYDRLVWGEDEIVALLAGTERRHEFVAAFGEASWRELHELARAAHSVRRRRAAVRAWVVPGIMGTQLGIPRPRPLPADVIWLDAIDLIAGRAVQLRFGARHGVRPLGVMPYTNLAMRLRLAAAGYDAKFFAYDWREDPVATGARFAAMLRAEGRPSVIVAHSMGGLVARAALTHAKLPPVERVVLVGTPHFGSFAAVQALRGTYAVVRRVAMLDLFHDAEELTRRVFRTFPSLYRLLPIAGVANGTDFHDRRAWPRTGPTPDTALLRAAAGLDQALAPADERFVAIAGHGTRTAVGAESRNGEFIYDYSTEGDGTVPLESASLPGAPLYRAQSEHSELMRSPDVGEAIVDLVRTGWTPRLIEASTTDPHGPAPAHAVERLSDADLRSGLHGKVDWESLGPTAHREYLQNLNAPAPRGSPGRAKPARADSRAGRRTPSTAHLDVQVVVGDIVRSTTSALAAALFEDVRPGGAIAALDARLGGTIEDFRFRRMLGGQAGRVTWVPAGARLGKVRVVLLAGLGRFDQLAPATLEIAAANVMRLARLAALDSLTTVAWATSAGMSAFASVEAQLRGFARGLAAGVADAKRPRGGSAEQLPGPFQLVIRTRDPVQAAALRAALIDWRDAGRAPPGVRLRISARAASASRALALSQPGATIGATRERRARAADFPTAYLLLNSESRSANSLTWRAAVLTAQSPAAIVAESQTFTRQALRAVLQQIEVPRIAPRALARFGGELAQLALHPTVREALAASKESALVVVHDDELSRVPWEALRLGALRPALAGGMSRRYAASELSLARFSAERRRDARLRVLLVADPTGDLPGAALEGERIEAILRPRAAAELVLVSGRAATRARLLAEFSSGHYDLLHYAGHGFFDPVATARSGIQCSDGTLSGADLAGLARLPSLVVFNACESARVRSVLARNEPAPATRAGAGLAESFLRAGVANYLGTYWPVGDESAQQFAQVFYAQLLRNATLGAAVRAGRRRIAQAPSADWADYIHFGDPDFRLKDDPNV